MRFPRWLAILALSLLTVLPAQAKGLFVINTGDEMFEVGAFPADVLQAYPAARDYQAGYKCSHFGVLWADAWTWDCKLVAVTGDNSYADLPADVAGKLAADAQYSFSHAKRNLWNHYGIVLLLAVLAGFVLYSRKGKAQPAAEAEPQNAA